MLGDTLVYKYGAAPGTPTGGSDVTLKKINQDGYTAEYLYVDGSGVRTRAFVRHSTEKTPGGYVGKVDRHQVLLRQEFGAGTSEDPLRFREAYVIIRHFQDDVLGDVENLTQGLLVHLTEAKILSILGWES
jgi:hypothetical protein